jgi:GDP-4-dehydro-6-deoxy-D-mannose reductase
VKVLVTGANGFVGGWLLRRLLSLGHEVVGGSGLDSGPEILTAAERNRVEWLPLDVQDDESVEGFLARPADAVVHLAGVASVSASLRDPVRVWRVNSVGTVRVVAALARRLVESGANPVVLVVSTAEVYGPGGPALRCEADPAVPVSPYAASKLAAEVAALEAWRRTGLRVVIARPFPHTGPGQGTRFVVPAFVERLREARRAGAPAVRTGNLEPVRDLLDVRDVVEAYLGLLERGQPGETYNVASGTGVSLRALFDRIADLMEYHPVPQPDASLARPVDIRHLVGDATRLRAATGWSPRLTLDQTLRQMIDAQAD